MHWRISGAQAMLNLRALWINDNWEAFHRHRKRKEIERLYPYRRDLVRHWPRAA